ncbi:MAG: type II toxin-antitoxin system RelE/ParE family toxin [Pirellulales bacterium]
MTYRIVVQPTAVHDVQQLYHWIAERSAGGALRWYQQWFKAVDSLRRNPLAYGLAPESDFVDVEIRQILFRTRRGRIYRALFSIEGEVVRVLHVRGSGQAPVAPDELQ